MAARLAAAVDISRLLTGLRFRQPTGIERMELGYAARLDDTAGGVALTPIGARAVSPGARRRIAAAARARWQEDEGSAEAERVLGFVETGARIETAPRPGRLKIAGLFPGLARAALRGPASAVPRNAAYVHTSFFRLERESYFDWLAGRPDIKAAFVLYDLLPLQYPDYFRIGEAALHAARISTAARRGRVLVTASQTVADDLRRHLKRAGLPQPPVHVAPLPVEEIFSPARSLAARREGRPFFLCCGTIEPRKNHRLLLDVWTMLAAEMGAAAPVLVIAGRRGWRNDDVFARLDNLGPLSRTVLEAPGLSSGALAHLMRSAAGVLSPSMGEGYGLPVAEALACGASVIAADTPVYRELWSGRSQLIDPHDTAGWSAAIQSLCRTGDGPQLNAGPPHAMRWGQHIDWIEGVLAAA